MPNTHCPKWMNEPSRFDCVCSVPIERENTRKAVLLTLPLKRRTDRSSFFTSSAMEQKAVGDIYPLCHHTAAWTWTPTLKNRTPRRHLKLHGLKCKCTTSDNFLSPANIYLLTDSGQMLFYVLDRLLQKVNAAFFHIVVYLRYSTHE